MEAAAVAASRRSQRFQRSASILLLIFFFFFFLSADGTPSDVDVFLSLHNQARAAVGVADLMWDHDLEAYAVSYSPTCALIHSHGQYGENLFIGNGKAWGASDAVEMWVAERESYHYETNSCDAGAQCGHYTQVVWRQTTSVGCAVNPSCPDGSTFIICSYNPPGNYVDQLPY